MGKKIVLRKGMGPHRIPSSVASKIDCVYCDKNHRYTLIDDTDLILAREDETLIKWVESGKCKTLEVFELPLHSRDHYVSMDSLTTDKIVYVSGGSIMEYMPDIKNKIKVVVDGKWAPVTLYLSKDCVISDAINYSGYDCGGLVSISGTTVSRNIVDILTFEKYGFDETNNACYITIAPVSR